MRYATTAIVMAAISIGEAMAGPAHAHLHRKAHEKKDVNYADLDWSAMDIDWAAAYSKGLASTTASSAPAPTVAATTPTSAAAVPTSAAKVDTSASVDTGSDTDSVVSDVTDLLSLFEGVVGVSNSRTGFGVSCNCSSDTSDDESYGETADPYGSNMFKADSTSGFDWTNTFINEDSEAMTINVWNKAGYNLEPLSGSALAPVSTTLTFVLSPGGSQVVAFMPNSEVAWAQACSQRTLSGAFATVWGEANIGTASKGSGYDVSAINNAAGSNYNMTITSLEAPLCTSSMTENYWLTANDPVGNSDGSCYSASTTSLHLTTIMAGTV